jgi:pimeloyl-ACP methyl ester carboxylesterase
MTSMEIALVLLDVLSLSLLLRQNGPFNQASKVLAISSSLLGAALMYCETLRWQIYPAVLVALILGSLSLRRGPISLTGKMPTVGGYFLVMGSLAACSLMPIFSLPTPSGPHAIGTDTRVWTRSEVSGSPASANAARRIVVQLWYPAAAGQTGPIAPYRDAEAGTLLTKYMRLVKTHAKSGVQVDTSQQKFPVLLFSPLWNSGRSPYTFFYEMLASHGFIVAAVEHVPDYDRSADDFETLAQMHELDARATRRALDLQFVLDRITELNASDPGKLFTGKFDLDRVGVLGHSFGGAASVEACYLDKRFKSAVNLDGAVYGAVAYAGTPQPIFYFLSDGLRDVTPLLNSKNKDERDNGLMEQLDRDRKIKWLHQYGGYYLRIPNSLHLDFTDRPLFSRIKRFTKTSGLDPAFEEEVYDNYVLAFFERTLNGKDEPLLDRSPSPYPTVLFFSYPNANAPFDPYSAIE